METAAKKIKILHFASVINRYDFIDTVIRFTDPTRFRMMACTFTEQSNIEPANYRQDGIPHFVLGVSGRKDYPAALVRLAHILRQEQVDILHTHHYDEALIGVSAALLARTPTVIIGRHYHDEVYLLANGIKRRALLAGERFVNSRARGIIVPSTPIRDLLLEKQGVQSDKVWVIPYGFDFNAERYRIPTADEQRFIRQEFGLNGNFVVGNFGRHHSLKGQEYLLHAFARFARDYPDARLLMVGDGPYHETLRRLASDLGLTHPKSGRVIFTGWRKDARQLVAAADVIVHPTLHEALPQLMIEAMAKGKPLVITNVSGVSDHITHLQTGFLIPKRNSDAIYEALCWVRQHPEEAKQMGNRGRTYVLEKLDIRSVIHSFEERYESIAQSLNGNR